MPPEQVRGESLDARSDLFSLGAVLYEMAIGRPAFGGDTTGVIFDALLNRTPRSPTRLNPEVPSKLEEIIAKLLDKDRKLRYQSAAELETDLRRLRRDTSASLSAAHEVANTKWRQAKVLVPTAVVIMAAIVAVLFLRAPRAAALTEQDVILLADFDNKTGDPVFDDTLKQATEFALEQSPFINLFPEESVRQALKLLDEVKKVVEEAKDLKVESPATRRILYMIAFLEGGTAIWKTNPGRKPQPSFGRSPTTAPRHFQDTVRSPPFTPYRT